jgi:hypothetical protein
MSDEKRLNIVPVLKFYVEYTLANGDKVESVDYVTREGAIQAIHSTADYEGYMTESPYTVPKTGRTESAEIKEVYRFEVQDER